MQPVELHVHVRVQTFWILLVRGWQVESKVNGWQLQLLWEKSACYVLMPSCALMSSGSGLMKPETRGVAMAFLLEFAEVMQQFARYPVQLGWEEGARQT